MSAAMVVGDVGGRPAGVIGNDGQVSDVTAVTEN